MDKEARVDPLEQAAPSAELKPERIGGQRRPAPVERVDAVDLREAPGQTVTIEAQPGEELRANGHRVNRRAVVVEQAGGKASTGLAPILEVQPTEIHQRVPLYIGSPREVSLAEEFEMGKR